MAIIITYNELNPFSGQPIPFVGRTKENISYGERWGSAERITMVGQLTGCSFADLTSAQLNLISGFSKDFQILKIRQDGADVGTYPNIFVNSIDFPSSNYVKLLPYQIDLTYYPQSSFTGFYGILEPSDVWDYGQTEDGLIEISHQVSARGIQTLSGFGALDNAKNFVLSRTGFANYVSPKFIQKSVPSGILRSQVENINRLESTYSITETYVSDQFYPCDYGVLRYSVDVGLNQAGFNSVSIKGSFEGGINDDFDRIKVRAAEFDYYSSALYAANSGVRLNPIPLSKQFTENSNTRKIDFSLNFDDNPNYQTNVVYNVGVNSGIDLISVSVNGEINGRGDLKNRYDRVKEAYALFSPYIVASQELVNYAGSGALLDKTAQTESVTYDPFNGSVSFDFSYQEKISTPNNDLLNFDYEVTVQPPLRKMNSFPLMSKTEETYSKYEVFDMGFDSRGKLTINGAAIPVRGVNGTTAINATESAIRGVYNDYSYNLSKVYLDTYSIGQNNAETINFNASWSFSGDGAIQGTNYSTIASL